MKKQKNKIRIQQGEYYMDHDKRLQKLETEMLKIMTFLPTVEMWMNVLAAQFQTNRNFILALDKKPEAPVEKPAESVTPNA